MPDTYIAPTRVSSPSPDSPSVATLWKATRATWRAVSKAMDASDVEMLRVHSLRPPCPVTMEVEYDRGDGQLVRRLVEVGDIPVLRETAELDAATCDQLHADLTAWRDACAASDKQHKDPSIAAKLEVAEQAYAEAEKRFIAAPALTVEDIGYKLRFLADAENYSLESRMTAPKLVFGLIRDITKRRIASHRG